MYLRHVSLLAMCLFALTAHATEHKLLKAAKAGDLSKVESFVDAGVPIDTVDRKGRTPLMLAIAKNHQKVMDALLRAGASTEIDDHAGRSASDWAQRTARKYRKKNKKTQTADSVETLAFFDALHSNNLARLVAFITQYPESNYLDEALTAKEPAMYAEAVSANTTAAFRQFIETYPSSPNAAPAKGLLEKVWWRDLSGNKQPNSEEIRQFLANYPSSPFIKAAKVRLAQDLKREANMTPQKRVRLFGPSALTAKQVQLMLAYMEQQAAPLSLAQLALPLDKRENPNSPGMSNSVMEFGGIVVSTLSLDVPGGGSKYILSAHKSPAHPPSSVGIERSAEKSGVANLFLGSKKTRMISLNEPDAAAKPFGFKRFILFDKGREYEFRLLNGSWTQSELEPKVD